MPDSINRRFTAVELVLTLGVMMIMLAMMATHFQTLHRAHGAFTQENRCLTVLANTVERLRVTKTPDQTTAQRILAEEFAAMEIPYKSDLEATSLWQNGALELHIRKHDGKPVAQVRFKSP